MLPTAGYGLQTVQEVIDLLPRSEHVDGYMRPALRDDPAFALGRTRRIHQRRGQRAPRPGRRDDLNVYAQFLEETDSESAAVMGQVLARPDTNRSSRSP